MSVILLRRGVAEYLSNGQTGTGISTNEVRLPVELMGARVAVQSNSTGVTADLQTTLDGTIWTSLSPTQAIGPAGTYILVLEGVLGLRANITANTGAATFLVRAQ